VYSSSTKTKKKVKRKKVKETLEMQPSETVRMEFRNHTAVSIKSSSHNDTDAATTVLYIEVIPEHILQDISNGTTNISVKSKKRQDTILSDPLVASESVNRPTNRRMNRRIKTIPLQSNQKWLSHLRKALYKSFMKEPAQDSIALGSDLWDRLNNARMKKVDKKLKLFTYKNMLCKIKIPYKQRIFQFL